MLNRPTTGVLPEQYELSRHAAERSALLTAVKQQRTLERRHRHPRLVGETVLQAVAIPH